MEDNALMKGIAASDRDAFGIIVHRYFQMLYVFVFRIIGDREAARDLVQDLFVKLWVGRRKISPTVSVRNYLVVSARNMSYNYLRLNRRHDPLGNDLPIDRRQIELMVIEEDANRKLLEAIEKLPPRSAEAIRLSLKGYKQETIAEQMNISLAAVKALKSSGIRKLREMLDAGDPD